MSNKDRLQVIMTAVTLLAAVLWVASAEIRLDRLERQVTGAPGIDTRYSTMTAGEGIYIGGKEREFRD